MVKRVISFTKPQMAWLEEESKRLDISVAELVRRIVDVSRQKGKGKDAEKL